MPSVRYAKERGQGDYGWLTTRYTFSFARYYDPEFLGFRVLRVMNEDWVHPSNGFETHPHDNMEILTLVLQGSLAHQDSMGNGSVIRAGELQRMSAGSGVTHSEFNPSADEAVHLYQIWLLPNEQNVSPSYEQKATDGEEFQNRFGLIASPDGVDASMRIHQDARVFLARVEDGRSLRLPLDSRRYGWLQIAEGSVRLGSLELSAGDGVHFSREEADSLEIISPSTLLFFDLP